MQDLFYAFSLFPKNELLVLYCKVQSHNAAEEDIHMQKQALLQAGLLGLQALVWRSVAGVRVMGWMMMTVWTMAGVVLCCGRWQNISTRHNDCQCSKCDTPAGPWRHIATSAPTLKIYRGGHSRHQDIFLLFLAWQNYIWFLASHCIAPCTFVSKHNLHFPLYVTTIDDNSIFHSLIVVFFTYTHTQQSNSSLVPML